MQRKKVLRKLAFLGLIGAGAALFLSTPPLAQAHGRMPRGT